ncbi:hypothetical protein Tco_1132234 [Tanacetum coccineum]|uniref:Protein TIC 214 n=1 Tax=Tanacetum coccineum TaxID=301880 RepID=A0ABQ5JEA3_9ASTR
MRSDKLNMFSDRKLTRLRTSLDDIRKNIRIEYLPQRRWSTLEKKRANIMIKVIDKQLKERMMIRSLENQNWRDLPRDIPLDSVEVLSNDLRVLRIILVILPEHQSDTKVIHNDDGNPSRANIKQALEGFNTLAGNPVKEILLKLNISDHRSILTDSKEYIKMDVERRSVKVKELQERCIIKLSSYHIKKSMSMSVQSYKMARLQDDVKRLCLVDDLKKFKITFISSQRYNSKPKVKDHYNISQHFKTLSLDELRSPDLNLFSDQEYLEEEVAETMAETMEQYMSKTRADYGSGVARPKIKDKDNFELKGQFLKELGTNTFCGSDHEDANEHIEKVLEIVDLFHILNITIDHVMLRV